MARRHKFRQGETIKSVYELIPKLERDEWVYLHGVPKHPSFLFNMSLATLRGYCRYSRIHTAIPTEDKNP